MLGFHRSRVFGDDGVHHADITVFENMCPEIIQTITALRFVERVNAILQSRTTEHGHHDFDKRRKKIVLPTKLGKIRLDARPLVSLLPKHVLAREPRESRMPAFPSLPKKTIVFVRLFWQAVEVGEAAFGLVLSEQSPQLPS